MARQLIAGAAELGVELSEGDAARLSALLDELDDWNQRMNLTAIRDRSQQITKHLLDSLSIQPYLHGEHVADVGTGAGFPGLPLALVNPQAHFTLIDSTAKKLKFIDHVTQLLELRNVETVHTRAETYRPKVRYRLRRVARGWADRDVREMGGPSLRRRRTLAGDEGPLSERGARKVAERMETRGGPST